MAWVSQERKKELAPAIKQVLKKYGLTGTVSVQNHSTLVVKITKGPIDFIKNYKENNEFSFSDSYIDVNTYWIHDSYTGIAKEALTELKEAMTVGNWDRSDIQTDYFDVGWYIDIAIGSWKKPYELVA